MLEPTDTPILSEPTVSAETIALCREIERQRNAAKFQQISINGKIPSSYDATFPHRYRPSTQHWCVPGGYDCAYCRGEMRHGKHGHQTTYR